jgi:predicted aspartyl protease
MRVRYFCLLSVLLATLAAADQQSATGYQEAGPPPASEATVKFDLYRGYIIVARGSAGPFKNLHFLLDTGNSATILDRRLARKLRLDELPATVAVLDGRVGAGKAVVPSLQFGSIRRDNFSVLIQNLSFLQKALSVRVDGVIGLDLLGKSTFVVDYTAREIYFGPPAPLPISLPMRVKGGLAIVDAELNHSPVHLLVDTGASSLIIFETRMPRSISGLQISAIQRSTNLNGDFQRKEVWLHSLRLGETEFGLEPVFVVHDSRDAGRDFDGLMSPAALGITRVAVDLERGVLGFSR